MAEKLSSWNQIFDVETLLDLRVLMTPESENHISAVCVCAISITQKHITVKTPKFGILHF